MGPSEVVVTDNDPELPRREAKRLADMLWAARDQLVAALRKAILGAAIHTHWPGAVIGESTCYGSVSKLYPNPSH